MLALDGVKLTITDDAIQEIAKRAVEMKTGARALRSILEGIMLDIMYKVPQTTDITEVIVDKGCLTGDSEPDFKTQQL